MHVLIWCPLVFITFLSLVQSVGCKFQEVTETDIVREVVNHKKGDKKMVVSSHSTFFNICFYVQALQFFVTLSSLVVQNCGILHSTFLLAWFVLENDFGKKSLHGGEVAFGLVPSVPGKWLFYLWAFPLPLSLKVHTSVY